MDFSLHLTLIKLVVQHLKIIENLIIANQKFKQKEWTLDLWFTDKLRYMKFDENY